MIYRFFDFEVFPEWWCLAYFDYEDNNQPITKEYLDKMRSATVSKEIRDDMHIITSEQSNYMDRIVKVFREPEVVLTGYGIKHYDLAIAYAIMNGETPQGVRAVNDLIMNGEGMPIFAACLFQDLMDDEKGSLKEKAGLLGLNVLDCAIPFDRKELSLSERNNILFYCKQDVYVAWVFFLAVKRPYIHTKLKIAEMFKIDVGFAFRCHNMALMSSVLLKDEERSDRELWFRLPSDIEKYVSYRLGDKICGKVMNHNDPFTVNMFGNRLSFGDGGLHSIYRNELYVESDSEYIVMNFDAEAYYPSIMLKTNTFPLNIDSKKFEKILKERLRMKHEKGECEEEEKALKLICNTVYGACGNQFSMIYSPNTRSVICRMGQLLIATLATELSRINGLIVLQINTDSVMCYFPRKEYGQVTKVLDYWSHLTSIEISQEEIKRVWQKDINNYLLERPDNTVKTRGAWLCDEFFNFDTHTLRSPVAPVCASAAASWLLRGRNLISSIYECKDPLLFTIPCKKGSAYNHLVAVYRGIECDLGRFARVYADNSGHERMIYRVKELGHGKKSYDKVPNVPNCCKELNDDMSIIDFNLFKGHIDYDFYVKRAKSLLEGEWAELVGGKLYKTIIAWTAWK